MEINLAALMFPALFALIFLGIPVSFSLLGVAIGFGFAAFGTKIGLQSFHFITRTSSVYVLASIPLFIFMGSTMERSGIAERLFHAMRLWVGRFPGGLAIATIAICAIFAAGTGIVGAVEVMVGLMAIPAMMKYGYDRGLIAGTICAGGSLGTMIPPSIVVVIYATIAQISIGKLFAGVLFPGGMMVLFFLIYLVLRCWFRPQDGPPMGREEYEQVKFGELMWLTFTALIPPITLVVTVVGSILAGVAAVTEAAAVGAAGALLLSVIYRQFSMEMLWDSLKKSIVINAMVMLIILGGTMFTTIFRMHGGGELVEAIIEYLDLSPNGMAGLFLAIIFMLGIVLDWVSIVLIVVPIFSPLLNTAGIDPVWFAVMAIIMIQTSYLTPPMAPSIFYLKGIAPPEMTYKDMYLGVMPFVLLQLLVLVVIALYPPTATYLPVFFLGN